MIYPSEKDFLKLSKKGNLIPVYKEALSDLDTPVSAYYKLCNKSKYSFLLESVEGEEKISQYSFLAKDPELLLEAKNGTVTITRFKNGKAAKKTKKAQENPVQFIRSILKEYKFVNIPGLPRFCGGMVGFMSYDMVRYFERLPDNTHDDLQVPDMLLMLTKELIIFDHRSHKIKAVCCVDIPAKATENKKKALRRQTGKRIDQMIKELQQPLWKTPEKTSLSKCKTSPKLFCKISKKPLELDFRSNFTKREFEQIVRDAKKDIRSGEIIQVVLSQRLSVDLKTDPFNVYRALRGLNPSPYMYYLHLGDIQIVGSSPELLVRCEDGIVDTRPIAGTRPRGRNEQEDAALAADLLNDPKERAEHVMLVDLGRNDLGRVCRKGSVALSEFMVVEKYSHVMHIISNVRGKLRKDKDELDVLEAAFPAGTLSGAPKIRAMEIIERLEKQRRGPYGGCIGYFSFSGNLDSCITIRTIVVKDKKAYVQAGAGIVADSKPKNEYQETINKAKAQLAAIKLAEYQNTEA